MYNKLGLVKNYGDSFPRRVDIIREIMPELSAGLLILLCL